MAWSRYEVVDAYVLEELRREYEAADAKGRIVILKKLQKDDKFVPFEIAALAAHDRNVPVRQWFARHGRYVSLEREPWKGTRHAWDKQGAAWSLLADSLRNDADPFVRACLHENPAVFHGNTQPNFAEATHIERLAWMRNPDIDTKLVEKIFDTENIELGIDMQARRELCRAFLSNKVKLHQLTDDAGLCLEHKGYWEAQIDAEKCLRALWELAAKWPEDSDIPFIVFREVPANGLSFLDENKNLRYVKAEIYRAHPRYRLPILFSSNFGWRDDEVIRLALQDANEGCRRAAFSKAYWVSRAWVLDAIKRKDRIALEGLADNESLSVEDLNKIQNCLNEIEPAGFQHAWITIDRKKKATISQDPERLFGRDGRGLLEEKVDFIGHTIAETKTDELTHKISSALLWARIAAVASALTILYLIFR